MKIARILAFICGATAVSTKYVTRLVQPTITLYSPNGRHLKISESGKVSSTKVLGHPLADLTLVVVGDNKFFIQGVLSGKYLAESGRGRLYAVNDRNLATKFTEAHLDNYFNQYRLVRDEKCSLSLSKRGSVRVRCNKKCSNSYLLPRRTHQRL